MYPSSRRIVAARAVLLRFPPATETYRLLRGCSSFGKTLRSALLLPIFRFCLSLAVCLFMPVGQFMHFSAFHETVGFNSCLVRQFIGTMHSIVLLVAPPRKNQKFFRFLLPVFGGHYPSSEFCFAKPTCLGSRLGQRKAFATGKLRPQGGSLKNDKRSSRGEVKTNSAAMHCIAALFVYKEV